MNYSFHPEAQSDVHDYYRKISEKVALAFTDEIVWGIEQIMLAPSRWKLNEQGTRRFLLSRFPYAIIYRLLEDEVQIIAVPHHISRIDGMSISAEGVRFDTDSMWVELSVGRIIGVPLVWFPRRGLPAVNTKS